MTSNLGYPFPVTFDVIVVRYKDIEQLIENIYGKEINIPGIYRMSNDSYLDIDLKNVTPDDYDMESLERNLEHWLSSSGSQFVDLEVVMADLVFKGELPASHYFIEIYW
jgi:hypothetical protein